ncbi:helix-turn-helix domain-containing protein [Paenibacillus sp. MER TA 81-3]|uniref:helix-turn-helix domain-containing protein n=1 Tax=Paenibacillus sp. MER TA 81-3 TaxID=2939573 RepID=UPI00203B59AF|nr:helix-turn-helix transcriptional regulator [Paenibacillus sp. MER TA 81-3]
MNDIGHKIKCIRKENNLNQVQFAKSIGISQGNLSEIELGNSNPSAETLISIRTQYNVNLNWLLTGVATEDGATYEDEFEKRLIEVFRNLDDYDKKEIIEIMQLKKRLRSNYSPWDFC